MTDSDVYARITIRKAEVLGGCAEGYSEPEIAAELDLSVPTVHRHLAELRTLLDLHKMPELGRWWRRNGGSWLLRIARRARIDPP